MVSLATFSTEKARNTIICLKALFFSIIQCVGNKNENESSLFNCLFLLLVGQTQTARELFVPSSWNKWVDGFILRKASLLWFLSDSRRKLKFGLKLRIFLWEHSCWVDQTYNVLQESLRWSFHLFEYVGLAGYAFSLHTAVEGKKHSKPSSTPDFLHNMCRNLKVNPGQSLHHLIAFNTNWGLINGDKRWLLACCIDMVII